MNIEKIKLWFQALRPKTLTASFVPVLIGTVIAYRIQGHISLSISLFALLCAAFIQIGTNLINDAIDFKKGADNQKRIGPKRLILSGEATTNQVMNAGFASLSLALLFGIPLILKGGLLITFLLIISVILAYLYTGGPFPLAYTGLGDLFVLLFFGLISTSVIFYLQTGHFNILALLGGAQIGLLATVLIAINNARDIENDFAAMKKTLAVRFGLSFARKEITGLIILAYLLGFFWKFYGYPFAYWIPLITLPLAANIIKSIWTLPPSEEYNKLLAQSALLHLLFAIALSVGIIL